MFRFALSLAFLIGVSRVVLPQEDGGLIFSLRELGVEDGLLHRRVTQAVQDSDGFIWLATPAGVQRFDGFSFRNWTTEQGLTTNAISMIWPDADGLLWLVSKSHYSEGHVSSIDILDPRSGSVVPFAKHFGSKAPCSVQDLVDKAILLNDGTLLLATVGKLIRYGPAEQGFTVTDIASRDVLRPIAMVGDGRTCCVRFRSQAEHFDLVMVDPSGAVEDVHGGPFWLGSIGSVEGCDLRAGGTGLYFLAEPLGGEVHEYLLTPQGVLLQMPGALDASELFQWNGALYLDLGNDNWLVDATIRHVPKGVAPRSAQVLFDPEAGHPSITTGLYHAMRDRAGHVWLCTEFGLWQLSIRPDHFQRWLQGPDPMDGPSRSFRGLVVMGDTLFAASEQFGWYALNVRNGRAQRLDDGEWALRYALVPDGHGGMWAGRAKSLLHWRHGQFTGNELHMDRVPFCVQEMEGGRLLIGTTLGLAWSDTALSDAEVFAPDAQGRISGATVAQLFRDRTGITWVCTSRGLGELDANGQVAHVWWRGDGVHYLPAEDFRHIHEDSAGIFWVSTATNGLLRWDRAHGEVTAITRSDGLPSNGIYAVYPDGAGMLWMPTDNGIACYDPTTGHIRSFSTLDGIAHGEFNRWSHAQGPDGRLYFGGLNGITAFQPADLMAGPHVEEAPLVITRLQQFDGTTNELVDRTASAVRSGVITMGPYDRYFTLSVALLSFEDPGSVLFGWRVEGVDAEWNLQREPVIRFAALPYGARELRIRAKGGRGVWTSELVVLLDVLRPWYVRWWAILAYVLLISAGVYALFRYRLSKVRAMVAMRDRIALDLHDEVGSTLSSVALFSTVMGSSTKDRPAEETAMLKRIAKNSAQAMEDMNDIVWSVNTRYEKLSDVEDRMIAFAGPIADAKGWDLEVRVEDQVRQVRLSMIERKNLYLIFKEAVNNAAKYAECDRVRIHLKRSAGRVELHVSDNGKGLPAEAVHNGGLGGNGSRSMRQRAAQINAELLIQCRQEGGTEVLLRFSPHAE